MYYIVVNRGAGHTGTISLKGGENMAIVSNKLSTVIQLKVKTGTDGAGNDVTAIDSYRNVKAAAQDSDIYEVAAAIGSMKSTPVLSIMKADTYELVNQE